MDELGVASTDEIDLVVMDYIIRPDWRDDWYRRPCETETMLAQVDSRKIHVINHHLAHAYNVFYSSNFESAAVLIVDGRGSEKQTRSEEHTSALQSPCNLVCRLLLEKKK